MVQEIVRPQITPTQENRVNNLREFADNLRDITDPTHPNHHISHDAENKKAFGAKAEWSTATHTTIAQNKKRDEDELKIKSISGARAMASNVGNSIVHSFEYNINLSGIRLDDSNMVDIGEDGILMVRGDGPDSDFREATLDEKLQLETESMACSIALTQEELEINSYLNGQTQQIPESLQRLAEEKGYVAEDLSRSDYTQFLQKKYASQPHIASQFSNEVDPLGSGLSNDSDINSLIPPRTSMPASPGDIASVTMKSSFAQAVDPAQPPLAPNVAPDLSHQVKMEPITP